MQRLATWSAVVIFAVGLSACGDNNITNEAASTPTASLPSATAASAPTATTTYVPSKPNASATVAVIETQRASFTATPTPSTTPTISVTSTRTATPTITPTLTATATITATPTVTYTSTPAGVIALYNADKTNPNNPFPSDRLLDATGHVALPAAYLTASIPAGKFGALRAAGTKTAAQLSALDGFGTFSPIHIRFSRPMVADAGTSPHGIMVLEYNNLDALPAPVATTAYGPDSSIEVQPIVPLKPKTRYAVVATTELTDVDGHHVKPSPDFARLLAGTDLSPDQAAWRATLLPVITFMKAAFDIDTDGLALVEVFTTQHTTDDLEAIQHRLTSGDLVPGAPCFENCAIKNFDTGIFPENTAGYRSLIGSLTSANVAKVAIGVFDSYDFRTGADGHFDPGYINGPGVPPKVNHLDFYMTIPKAPMPPNGYPIAIYGHTLGGDGTEVGLITTLNATVPVVTIAISDVDFGMRGNMLDFFVFNNPATLRENFRQTVADYLQETKMVQNAHAAGTPPFDIIDPDNIIYLGASLGGIMGGMYMAVQPDVKIGMLSVPGGGLTNILDTPEIGGLLGPLIGLVTGVPATDPYYPQFFHGFQQTAQWAIDAGDPINYAPYIVTPGAQLPGVPPKHILVQEGFIDTIVGNRATEDLALAMQLPDLNVSHGCSSASGCSGIWRYVMTDYDQTETDGHYVTLRVEKATQQAFDYLTSLGTLVDDASP